MDDGAGLRYHPDSYSAYGPRQMNAPLIDPTAERRTRQRFVAKRQGEVCFWALVDGQRLALNDLSLEGFSLPASSVLGTGLVFDFVLNRDGVPDEISGSAEVVNQIAASEDEPAKAGCRFVRLEDASSARLHDWLVAHVLVNATVRITEKDATAIVSGPSLI
ncbi:MAG: PilZ domain-containing protein [Azoarcus sp.]|nr:PilZ domain-containing protein [Azoarcus sp.]